jgi:hypothetical protein
MSRVHFSIASRLIPEVIYYDHYFFDRQTPGLFDMNRIAAEQMMGAR